MGRPRKGTRCSGRRPHGHTSPRSSHTTQHTSLVPTPLNGFCNTKSDTLGGRISQWIVQAVQFSSTTSAVTCTSLLLAHNQQWRWWKNYQSRGWSRLCWAMSQQSGMGALLEKSVAGNTAKVDVGGSNWMHCFVLKS
eukprot:scaffold13564_cov128-Alexandrium_tamarense.AAC.19